MKFDGVLREFVMLLVKISASVLVFVLVFTFLYGITRYQEPHMAPAVKDGDLVIYYRYAKHAYRHRDLVVVDTKGGKDVRRIVAQAGDTVDITSDGLIVNGALQQEPEISSPTYRFQEGVDFPLTVAKGEVFVLADERNGALDSRIYGAVSLESLSGKVMTIVRRRNF